MRKNLIIKLLNKRKPLLVAVFGRYGKEEARMAVAAVLAKHSSVFHSTAESFFRDLYKHLGGFLGIFRALVSGSAFPDFCIITTEPDNDNFNELKEILDIDLALIMPVGDIPSFSDVFAGAQKKSEKIVREARKAEHIVYIYDDETIRGLVHDMPVSKRSYGFSEGANIRIHNINNWIYIKQKVSGGATLKVEYDGILVPFNLLNCYGNRNIYAASAALGAALHYEMNFIGATQDLSDYKAPRHSLRLYSGIKSSAVISHTDKITPLSAREAIELFGSLRQAGEFKRLAVVLGDVLLRIHEEAEGLHRVLGELAAHNVDELILVGERVIFTKEEAGKHGMAEGNITHFHTSEELVGEIGKKIEKGDAVLVLGSKEMHLNKVVESLKA